MVRVSSNFNNQDQRSVVNFSTHNFADVRFFLLLLFLCYPERGASKTFQILNFTYFSVSRDWMYCKRIKDFFASLCLLIANADVLIFRWRQFRVSLVNFVEIRLAVAS